MAFNFYIKIVTFLNSNCCFPQKYFLSKQNLNYFFFILWMNSGSSILKAADRSNYIIWDDLNQVFTWSHHYLLNPSSTVLYLLWILYFFKLTFSHRIVFFAFNCFPEVFKLFTNANKNQSLQFCFNETCQICAKCAKAMSVSSYSCLKNVYQVSNCKMSGTYSKNILSGRIIHYFYALSV